MYKLANQVVSVKGRQRGALLDLRGERMHRVPLEVLSALESPVRDDTRGRTRTWMRHLEQLRFVRATVPDGWEPFRSEGIYPRRGRVQVLTISPALDLQAISHWIARIGRGQFRHIFVRAVSLPTDTDRQFAHNIAQRAGSRTFEVAGESEGRLSSTVYLSSGQPIAQRIFDRSFVRQLKPSVHWYEALTKVAEIAGILHVDAGGTIWPHPDERHFSLGTIFEDSFSHVIESDRYRRLVAARKDLRSVCGECELRHCCVYPLAARAQPEDLFSAPASCRYDPLAEEPQNALFS